MSRSKPFPQSSPSDSGPCFSEYFSADQLIVALVRAGWHKAKATEEDLSALISENHFYFEELTCPNCTATHLWLTLCPNESLDDDDLRLVVVVHRDGSFGDWLLCESYAGTTTGYNPSELSIMPESVAQMLMAWQESVLEESF